MLKLLLSDPALRENAGKRAQARVRENYLWDAVVAQMAAVYSSLKRPRNAAASEDQAVKKAA